MTILTHEPVAAYAPYYLAALLICRPTRTALKSIVIPVVVSAIALYAALQHPGTPETANKICASLGDPALCGDAISYIGLSKEAARAEVIEAARDFHYYRNYCIMLLLSLIPVIGAFLGMWKQCRRDLLIVAITCFVSSLISIQLFCTE